MFELRAQRPDTTAEWHAARRRHPAYRLHLVRASVVSVLILAALFALVWFVGADEPQQAVMFGP